MRDPQQATGKKALFLKLDLADLKSVKAAAEEFSTKEKELNVLFNNAGVMTPPIDQLTAQGYDLQFGTNVLGHFTKLLIPVLLAGAKTSPARVVTMFTNKIDFDTLGDTAARRTKKTHVLYFQAKLGNVVVSNEFARRFGEEGIVCSSVNPGNIQSELTRYSSRVMLFVKWMLWETPYGALTQLWAGTSPEGANCNGRYLIPWARVGTANKAAQDPKLGEDLWSWLEDQTEKF